MSAWTFHEVRAIGEGDVHAVVELRQSAGCIDPDGNEQPSAETLFCLDRPLDLVADPLRRSGVLGFDYHHARAAVETAVEARDQRVPRSELPFVEPYRHTFSQELEGQTVKRMVCPGRRVR